MRETNQPDPVRQFTCHVWAVCTIAVLAIALGAAQTGDPAPLALLAVAAMTRWIETFHETVWRISGIILDTALRLMTADFITFWT